MLVKDLLNSVYADEMIYISYKGRPIDMFCPYLHMNSNGWDLGYTKKQISKEAHDWLLNCVIDKFGCRFTDNVDEKGGLWIHLNEEQFNKNE